MSFPISVTIANLVMEHIEIKAINSFFFLSNSWTKFIDNTFVIIESDTVENFFAYIQ